MAGVQILLYLCQQCIILALFRLVLILIIRFRARSRSGEGAYQDPLCQVEEAIDSLYHFVLPLLWRLLPLKHLMCPLRQSLCLLLPYWLGYLALFLFLGLLARAGLELILDLGDQL